MYRLFTCIIYLISLQSVAQNFINSDLEGAISMDVPPPGWQNVPFGDPNCLAYISMGTTPDVTGLNGPSTAMGIMGNPQSGQTFISGLMGGEPDYMYQEGIMQTVSGFTPGETYSIVFYQTVVRQYQHIDTSGSWAVYIDSTLAGISAVSISQLPVGTTSLVWDKRTVFFTATLPTHTIKFLPMDDDDDPYPYLSPLDQGGALRMGIDNINISINESHAIADTICAGDMAMVIAYGATVYQWAEESNPNSIIASGDTLFVSPTSTNEYLLYTDIDTISVTVVVVHPPTVDLGPDIFLCEGDTVELNPSISNSTDYLWNNNSSTPYLITDQGGMYWLKVSNDCGNDLDSIQIIEDVLGNSPFGFDTMVCNHESIVLDAFSPTANYLWQDLSTSSTYTVTTDGKFWVAISNSCKSVADTFNVKMNSCEAMLEMPNIFSPNGDEINEYYFPVFASNITDFSITILNRWGQSVFESVSIHTGWDGTQNGQDCKEGVYFWSVTYKDIHGLEHQKQGFLTLIR